MTTPFTASGVLAFPPDDGQPVAPIPFQVASTFEAKLDKEIPLTGSGTHSIDLSDIMAAGARALLIELDFAPSVAPVMVRFNGGNSTGQVELTAGGFLFFSSPVPDVGITSIDLVYTSSAKLRVRVLG